MAIGSGIAIYFVIWWIALFAVLPFGARSQIEEGSVVPGTEPGAPARLRLLRVCIWTTVVASVVFAALLAMLNQDYITLDSFWFLPGGRIEP